MKNRLNWVDLPTQNQLDKAMYDTFTFSFSFNIYAKSFNPRVVLVTRGS